MDPLFAYAALAMLPEAIHLRAKSREEAIEAEFPPEGELLDIEGVQVHALVRGTGPDLVLIHGSSGNLRDFSFALVDQLAERYRVIAFDRPGMGHTGRTNYEGESIFEQAALLQKAAARLGADKPIVLGQSYGGCVALAWAVDHPQAVSALVLVASATQPWDGPLPPLYRLNSSTLGANIAVPLLTAVVPRSRIEAMTREVFAPDPMPEGYDRFVGAELAARREALRANAQHRASLLGEVRQMQPRYGALTLPIEMIHGDADPIVPLDIHGPPFVAQVASAHLEVLSGAGHLPHQTRIPDTIAAIDRAASRAGLR